MNKAKLTEILSSLLKVSEEMITDELTVEGCPSWDSLTHVKILSELEEAFDLDFDVQDAIEMDSVAAIKEVLGNKGVEL